MTQVRRPLSTGRSHATYIMSPREASHGEGASVWKRRIQIWSNSGHEKAKDQGIKAGDSYGSLAYLIKDPEARAPVGGPEGAGSNARLKG